MNRAPLILVVGMHRSGTSLLGSILQALGVALPGPLIPGDPHNPAGYFERSDITALQEELLIDLQRWWPSEQGTLSLPVGWSKTARAQRVAHHLKLLLKDEQGQQSGPWAIKDPRSSLLLPLWRQVAAELDQPLRLLLAFRDPAEVVTSLITRDAEATGMTTARAQALWIRHQQQPLLDADDLPLHVVSYSRWFDAPRAQVEALQGFCHSNRNDSQAQALALACIRPDYRRSKSSSQHTIINRQTQRWHQQLERAAASSPQALRHWAAQQPRPSKPYPWRQSSTALQHPWIQALKSLGLNTPEAQSKGIISGNTRGSSQQPEAAQHTEPPGVSRTGSQHQYRRPTTKPAEAGIGSGLHTGMGNPTLDQSAPPMPQMHPGELQTGFHKPSSASPATARTHSQRPPAVDAVITSRAGV